MAWTDLSAYAAGRFTVAMAELLRGNFKAIGDPWGSYTPTWTASTTNPTIGNGTISGRVMAAGKLTICTVTIVFGSTTTVGSGTYAFTTPSSMFSFRTIAGNAQLFDTSAGTVIPRTIFGVNGNTFVIADFTPTRISNASPITWAVGDQITAMVIYEAA